MVDKTNAAAFPGDGQSPEAPATAPAATGQQAGQTAAQPQYVTLDQARQLAAEAAEEAFRRAQSLYAKGQAGFEKKVQADLKNLEKALDLQKKAGVTITPEQENHMRQQVINQAFMDEGQPTQQQIPGQPAQADEGDEPPDPITASAWKMMDTAGIDILEDDPEFATLNDTDPYAFLKSVEAAIEAKRKRLAGQGAPQPAARTPTNAGGSGSTPPASLGKSPDEIWEAVKASGRI